MEITKIYLVENCYGDPNKVYIGKTKNNRKYDHKKIYGENIIYNYIDQIKSLNQNDWEPLETFWIEQFRQWGFDVQNKRMKGGSGPSFHTQEIRDKISEGNKGKKVSQETRDKMSKYAKNRSQEHIDKISTGNKGKIISQETKDRISKIHKYKQISQEIKDKISQSSKGKKHTQESRNKISQSSKGKIFSQEHRNKISLARQKSILQYDLEGNFIKEWPSILSASKELKINNTSISKACKGEIKSLDKFRWRYKEKN